MRGDQILSVNNDDTRNATQDFAAQILKVMSALLYNLRSYNLCLIIYAGLPIEFSVGRFLKERNAYKVLLSWGEGILYRPQPP